MRVFSWAVLFAAAQSCVFAAPSFQVSGGLTLNGASAPLLFTVATPIAVSGSGWKPGERVVVAFRGPLNLPSRADQTHASRTASEPHGLISVRLGAPGPVLADLVSIGVVTADAAGNFSASLVIPYDSGATGQFVRIPRPGYYEVRATGSGSGTAIASSRVNLCPATHVGGGDSIDWGVERGGRDGVFPGPVKQFSPERFDPEWPTVWEQRPVEVYGTIAPGPAGASEQPARISPSDNPPTHYAHDTNFFLVPDTSYRWLIGTANYYNGEPGTVELGRLELEWETLNGGSTSTYDQGQIGLPLWASPTVGDRVYAVGRWILDAGHPEEGARTEIHPPRLMATMRKRPVVSSSGAAGSQVDIYVSGHGGGANFVPPGLAQILNQQGHGGGRIRDVLSPEDVTKYYRPGPLPSIFVTAVTFLVSTLTGQSITSPIYADAGPTAFPWGVPGVEENAVNDMDYEFDVPLPPAPPGTTSVRMEVVTQAQHNTVVNEIVTYPTLVNGLPATAHVRLPFHFAPNGIYARTLRFFWNNAAPPPGHFVVRLQKLNVLDSAGKWQLWADVSGRWTYLSGLSPAVLNTSTGTVTLPSNQADVFLNSGDTLRVHVHGYRAMCLDDFFGKLLGQNSYTAGLTFVIQCGPVDNQDLGAAVLELPLQPSPQGSYTVTAVDGIGAHHFSVDLTIE